MYHMEYRDNRDEAEEFYCVRSDGAILGTFPTAEAAQWNVMYYTLAKLIGRDAVNQMLDHTPVTEAAYTTFEQTR